MMRQSNQLALAILLGTSLAACNGGGGGGDDSGGNKSTSAVVLTDSNKQQVAHNAVGAVDAASSVSSSGAGILGGVQVSGQQQKVQWPLLLARRGIELLNGANFAPALLGGVAQSITLPCLALAAVRWTLPPTMPTIRRLSAAATALPRVSTIAAKPPVA